MEDLDKNKKIDVLVSALEERYKALHIIRERVQSIGIWALGILLAAGGWLLQSDILLTPFQKLTYILGIAVALAVLRFKYLEDLEIGFKSQRGVAVRLEKTLGFFTPGVFDGQDTSVYPPDWENVGNGKGGGRFFQTTYLLLYISAAFLLIIILLNGCSYGTHKNQKLLGHYYQTLFAR